LCCETENCEVCPDPKVGYKFIHPTPLSTAFNSDLSALQLLASRNILQVGAQPNRSKMSGSKTFTRFDDLPWELRNHIWKLAVRPDLPGANFFFGPYDAIQRSPTTGRALNLLVPSFRHNWDMKEEHRVAAQKNANDTNSLTCLAKPFDLELENDKSAYLIDSGLWTACKESRLVVEKEFRSRGWLTAWHDPNMRDPPMWPFLYKSYEAKVQATCSSYSVGAPVAGLPKTGDSSTQYFHIVQRQDLSVLQCRFDEMAHPDDGHRFFLDLSGYMNSFFYRFALELNPVWGSISTYYDTYQKLDDRLERVLEFVVDLIDSTGAPWYLIDYTAKRSDYPMPAQKESPLAFYASDRRFVDLQAPCHPLMLEFWSKMTSRWGRPVEWWSPHFKKIEGSFKVLACEFI